MLKLGVLRPEQFFATPPRNWASYVRYRLSRSRVSLRLLETEDPALFERLMPFVQLSNGVYRTTFRKRFANLDPRIERVLAENFSAAQELHVEDWAASACLTSCEWAASLFRAFPRAKLTASDLALFLVEVEDKDSGEVFIAEESGALLQAVQSPFVLRMSPEEPQGLPVNRWMASQARRRWKKAAELWPLPQEWLESSADSIKLGGFRLRKLSLVHPEARTLAREDSRFGIRRHSVFDRAPDARDVIRTMNILNRAYFSAGELAQGAGAVHASLRPGGIWIVGRTVRDEPAEHAVSMFRKRGTGGFELVERVGEGSEIDEVAGSVR